MNDWSEQMSKEGEEPSRPRVIYPKLNKKEIFAQVELTVNKWYKANANQLNVENEYPERSDYTSRLWSYSRDLHLESQYALPLWF